MFIKTITKTLTALAIVSYSTMPVFASIMVGHANANVTITEVMDYTCAHCRAISPVIEKLLKQDSHVKMSFIPVGVVPDQGPNAGSTNALFKAALGYEIARTQPNHFMSYTKAMFHRDLSQTEVLKLLPTLGIDVPSEDALHQNWIKAQINQGLSLLLHYRTGTPLFFIVQSSATGSRPYVIKGAKAKLLLGTVAYLQKSKQTDGAQARAQS